MAKAQLGFACAKDSAEGGDVVVSWASDSAAFELAKVVGIECDGAALVVVGGEPLHDEVGDLLPGHVGTGPAAGWCAFPGGAQEVVGLGHGGYLGWRRHGLGDHLPSIFP